MVPDRRIRSNESFKRLSMGSERWLPIEEVKPDALLNYLRDRRHAGWQVVALEQAHGSVPIQSFTFSPRTILLLGAESDGVPAELLEEVDSCVEIPQAGLIRSLNVHVSASITLWECTRQRLCRGAVTQ